MLKYVNATKSCRKTRKTTKSCRESRSYRERNAKLKHVYNFECNCRLCELERADQKSDERDSLLKRFTALKASLNTDAQWFRSTKALVEKVGLPI